MMILNPLVVVADVVPFIGNVLSAGAGVVSLALTAVVAPVVIAIAWLWYRRAEKVQLAYYELRLQEVRTQRPVASIDDLAGALFPGVRFVGPSGKYEAGQLSLAMYEIVQGGGFSSGGVNFDAKLRRQSMSRNDLFHAHIGGIDTVARALLVAADMVERHPHLRCRDRRMAKQFLHGQAPISCGCFLL